MAEPCPSCGGVESVERIITGSVRQVAQEWNTKLDSGMREVLRKIKRASGSGCTIKDY